MELQLRQYPTAKAFLADCEAFLLENEPLNNLILGLAYALRDEALDCENPLFVSVYSDQILLCALQTPPRGLVLAGGNPGDLDPNTDAALDLLTAFLETEWPRIPEVFAMDEIVWPFAEKWCTIWDYSAQVQSEQLISSLEKLILPAPAPGKVRLATLNDAPEITRWFLEFHKESLNQEIPDKDARNFVLDHISMLEVYLWENEKAEPVSMAMSTRKTTNLAVINYVYTPPRSRSQGFASNCVAEVVSQMLNQGKKQCVLFREKSNLVTSSIYGKMGFKDFGDFCLLSFLPNH